MAGTQTGTLTRSFKFQYIVIRWYKKFANPLYWGFVLSKPRSYSDVLPSPLVATVTVENFTPDPEVYVAAAGALWNSTFTNHNEAIRQSFFALHPTEPKKYAGKYVQQFRQGFNHHPWWTGRSTKRKLKIKARALALMASTCETPNLPRSDNQNHYTNATR